MLLNVIVRRNRKSLQYTYFKKHAIYSVFKTRKRKTSVLGGASIYMYTTGENNDKPHDLGLPYVKTNPHISIDILYIYIIVIIDNYSIYIYIYINGV